MKPMYVARYEHKHIHKLSTARPNHTTTCSYRRWACEWLCGNVIHHVGSSRLYTLKYTHTYVHSSMKLHIFTISFSVHWLGHISHSKTAKQTFTTHRNTCSVYRCVWGRSIVMYIFTAHTYVHMYVHIHWRASSFRIASSCHTPSVLGGCPGQRQRQFDEHLKTQTQS